MIRGRVSPGMRLDPPDKWSPLNHLRRCVELEVQRSYWQLHRYGASAIELQELAFLTYAVNVYRETEKEVTG